MTRTAMPTVAADSVTCRTADERQILAIVRRAELAAVIALNRIGKMVQEGGQEAAIRRAYHQIAAALGATHGTDAAGAMEIIEDLLADKDDD